MLKKASRPKPSQTEQKVAKARKALKTMSEEQKIDLMVKANVMTQEQAAKTKKALVKNYVVPGVQCSVTLLPKPAVRAAKKK